MINVTAHVNKNSENQVEPSFFEDGKFTSDDIFFMFTVSIMIIGIVGNSLSSFVFSRKHMKTSTIGYLLLCLSLVDLLDAIIQLPIFILYYMPYFPGYVHYSPIHLIISVFYGIYIHPISYMTSMCSQYIIVLISVERWFAVCRPLQVRRYCTRQNTKRALSMIVFFSIIFNVSRFMHFTNDEETGYMVYTPLFFPNNIYFKIYGIVSVIVSDAFIPFVILLVTNIDVIRILHKSGKERKKMTQKQVDDRRTTYMLVTMIVLHAFCHVLDSYNTVLNLTASDSIDSPSVHFIELVAGLLNAIYTTSSCFVYLAFSLKYRAVVKGILTCDPGYFSGTKQHGSKMTMMSGRSQFSASSSLKPLMSSREK